VCCCSAARFAAVFNQCSIFLLLATRNTAAPAEHCPHFAYSLQAWARFTLPKVSTAWHSVREACPSRQCACSVTCHSMLRCGMSAALPAGLCASCCVCRAFAQPQTIRTLTPTVRWLKPGEPAVCKKSPALHATLGFMVRILVTACCMQRIMRACCLLLLVCSKGF
jgi:hypothetical protein